MSGKVSLVGAGPGDPELLTLKAFKAIQNAEAVVYDRLVSDEIMALVPRGVPRFFAGKSCKQKAMTQEEIHELLIKLAESGKQVVRLKGGDPLLFGRGGEEAIALAGRNIDFDIVPGITSAQGCGAYAGIPLTHRGLATGVRFITGHREVSGAGCQMQEGISLSDTRHPSPDTLNLNWPSLADPDTTLVVYMGLANIGAIAEKLIEHGLPATTPAAAIAHGTTPRQQVIVSTLKDIHRISETLESPTLVVIGKVAALAEELGWVMPADGQTPLLQSLSQT